MKSLNMIILSISCQCLINVYAFLESFSIEECEIRLRPIRKYLPICVISSEYFVA